MTNSRRISQHLRLVCLFKFKSTSKKTHSQKRKSRLKHDDNFDNFTVDFRFDCATQQSIHRTIDRTTHNQPSVHLIQIKIKLCPCVFILNKPQLFISLIVFSLLFPSNNNKFYFILRILIMIIIRKKINPTLSQSKINIKLNKSRFPPITKF